MLSRVSLLVSCIAPFFIALNYFRDRAIAKAFSTVIQSEGYTNDGKDLVNSYLTIKITNAGRRPLQLTHFIVRFPKCSERREVKYILNEKSPENQENELDAQFSNLMSQATLDYDENGIPFRRLKLDEDSERIIEEHSVLMTERLKSYRKWCLVAQNHALLLEGGQALERTFMLDYQDEKYRYFIDSISGKIAIDLFIEDAFGSRYKVKDFRKNIQKLFG